jgi:hypothetical protein
MKKVIVLASLFFLVAAGCSKNTDTNTSSNGDNMSQTAPSDSPAATNPVTTTPQTTTPKKIAPKPTATYSAALKAFGVNRIQFDQNCNAFPARVVFKGGTKIMIDNRDDTAKKITVGATTLNVGVYNYSTVTLPTTTVEKTLTVNCGALKNAATITLAR